MFCGHDESKSIKDKKYKKKLASEVEEKALHAACWFMFKSGRNLFLNFCNKEGKVKEKLFLGGFDWRFHVAGCKIP